MAPSRKAKQYELNTVQIKLLPIPRESNISKISMIKLFKSSEINIHKHSNNNYYNITPLVNKRTFSIVLKKHTSHHIHKTFRKLLFSSSREHNLLENKIAILRRCNDPFIYKLCSTGSSIVKKFNEAIIKINLSTSQSNDCTGC